MTLSSSKLVLLVACLGLLLFSFSVSLALDPPPSGPACKVETPQLFGENGLGYWGSNPNLLPCGVVDPATGVKVDCLECGICGLLMLGQRIIYFLISVLFFIVAPLYFIWGGFLVLISRGSSEMLTNGRKKIYHTVIGLLIGLGAFLIIQTFLWLLGGAGITGGGRVGWPNINCQRNLSGYTPSP